MIRNSPRRRVRARRLLWLALPLLAVACDFIAPTPPLPTRRPTALPAAPTLIAPSPTAGLPPTRDLATPTPAPTAVQPTPTRRPSPTPTAGAAAVNITSPGANAAAPMGGAITVGGLANLDPADQQLVLRLLSTTGRLLAETAVAVTDGLWQTTLDVPEFIGGPGQLQAAIVDLDGTILASDLSPVQLAVDTAVSDRYIALFRPVGETTAVAGSYLFFDGWGQRPAGGLTIAVLVDNCQTTATRTSFTMNGSGYWQGFVVIPDNVSGPACAIAYFGARDEPDWREVQLPITIVPETDPTARGVVLSTPTEGAAYQAGEVMTAYGVAYNPPDGRVDVSVLLENGRIITQQSVDLQEFGYWELDILLPVDVAGPAEINIAAGDPAFPTASARFEIAPFPTPAP